MRWSRPRLLRSAVWLVREQGSGTRQATDMALLPHLHCYARQIELGSTEAIKHAAAANLGLTCLSRLAVADWLQDGTHRRGADVAAAAAPAVLPGDPPMRSAAPSPALAARKPASGSSPKRRIFKRCASRKSS
jgi:DNA-binding transcriptional LysR family regulator